LRSLNTRKCPKLESFEDNFIVSGLTNWHRNYFKDKIYNGELDENAEDKYSGKGFFGSSNNSTIFPKVYSDWLGLFDIFCLSSKDERVWYFFDKKGSIVLDFVLTPNKF
jgi:hypothetical protein